MQVRIDEGVRSSLISRWWKEGIKVLTAVQLPVIQRAHDIDPYHLRDRLQGMVDKKPMDQYLEKLWIKTGSVFALATDRKIRTGKESIPELSLKDGEVDYWEQFFRRYYNQRSQQKLGLLMDTQTEVINGIIDRAIREGELAGSSIPEIQRSLINALENELTLINRYQAERIARTEVIGSSNKGSFTAADQTGLVKAKEWRTSGLPGVRPSHQENQDLGEVEMDYVYPGNCQYPGDPEGEPEEIINCRCTHIFNVD